MILKYRVQNVRVPGKVLNVLCPQVGRREQQTSVLWKDLTQLSVGPALYVFHMQAVVLQGALAWKDKQQNRIKLYLDGGGWSSPIYSLLAALVISHNFEQFKNFVERRTERIHQLHPLGPGQNTCTQRYLLNVEGRGTLCPG